MERSSRRGLSNGRVHSSRRLLSPSCRANRVEDSCVGMYMLALLRLVAVYEVGNQPTSTDKKQRVDPG